MAELAPGEVVVSAGGKERILRFDVNAMIAIRRAWKTEEDLGFLPVFAGRCSQSLEDLRTATYIALKAHDKDITEDEAGLVITEIGTHAMCDHISKAMAWALPPKKEADATDKGEEARPFDGPTSS